MADYDESMQEAEEHAQRRQGDGKQGKTKGRGTFTNLAEPNPALEDRYGRARFSELDPRAGPGPTPSVEGWVVFATGVHEEAQEEDLHEAFSEYGEVKNIYMNLDRQTGFVKGYALIEYKSKKEAQAAIDALNGAEILGQKVSVDYAFKKGDIKKRAGQGRARR